MTQKAIGDLLEHHYNFFIPFYQRGYRWDKVQVEALLEDLWEFHRKVKKKDEGYNYYSLQPLVVKKDEENNRYIVIDGQQRLTTLYLIISALENRLNYEDEKYSINYEREGSAEFLSKIKDNDNRTQASKENIDFYYMSKNYETIEDWIEQKEISKSNLKKFQDFILEGSDIEEEVDINKNIRFIWYELPKDEDEFDVFIRLNIGKIPLTDAELIKSYIIQKEQAEDKEQRRFEISKEWDDIEYSLQSNEFFGFLTKDEFDTRVELILQILLDIKSYKAYELYEKFLKKYENQDAKKIWDEIREIYQILKFWYEDRELYHLIGYLIATGKNININIVNIYAIYKSDESKDKNDFKNRLLNEIKSIVKLDNELENLEYGSSNSKIESILLLFNITSLIDSSKDTYIKFSFDKFNKEEWSLEHITPQTDKIKGKYKNFIEALKALNNQNVNEIIGDKNELNEVEIKTIEELFIDEEFKNNDKNQKHNIRNLALLSRKDNSSLKNNFFPVKRANIIQKDKQGEFIPIVTKNIFLKYYTNKMSEPLKWSYSVDGESYLQAMKESLNKFLGEI